MSPAGAGREAFAAAAEEGYDAGQAFRGDDMSAHPGTIGLAAAGLLLGTLAADHAQARDTTFQMRNQTSFSVQRYPGDQAFEGGTVRFQGPEKGPYIERCSWTIGNVFDGPVNLTQRCYRHTLENTPE